MTSTIGFDFSKPGIKDVLEAWTKYHASVANYKVEWQTTVITSQGESMSFTREIETNGDSCLSITTNHTTNGKRKSDEVIGRNHDYVFRLQRAADKSAWIQVELYRQSDRKNLGANALFVKLEQFARLMPIGPISLTELVSSQGVSTTCSMSGDALVVDFTALDAMEKRQPFGKGQILLSKVPPFLPTKINALLHGSDRVDYELEINWKVVSKDAQFPEIMRLIQRGGEHTLTSASRATAISLGTSKEADFRLSRFGLPEPAWLTPATAEPAGVPWTLYGVAAGFALLIVCILLSRRKAATGGG